MTSFQCGINKTFTFANKMFPLKPIHNITGFDSCTGTTSNWYVTLVYAKKILYVSNYVIVYNWYLSAKHEALQSKSKDWLTRNQDNVYEWNDISTLGVFQRIITLKIQLDALV